MTSLKNIMSTATTKFSDGMYKVYKNPMITLSLTACIAIISVIISISWGFSLKSDFGDFKNLRSDRVRGVITDFIVGTITLILTIIVLKLNKQIHIADISMIVFMFQEVVNFLCDNALRNVHLRYHYEPEIGEVKEVWTFDSLKSRTEMIFDLKKIGESEDDVEGPVYCPARNQILKPGTEIFVYDANRLEINPGTLCQLTHNVDDIGKYSPDNDLCKRWKIMAGASGHVLSAEEIESKLYDGNSILQSTNPPCGNNCDCLNYVAVYLYHRYLNTDIELYLWLPVCLLRFDYNTLIQVTQNISQRYSVLQVNHGITTRIMNTRHISSPVSNSPVSTSARVSLPPNVSLSSDNLPANIPENINQNIVTEPVVTEPVVTEPVVTEPVVTNSKIESLGLECIHRAHIQDMLPLSNRHYGHFPMGMVNAAPGGFRWVHNYDEPSRGNEIVNESLRNLLRSRKRCTTSDCNMYEPIMLSEDEVNTLNLPQLTLDSYINLNESETGGPFFLVQAGQMTKYDLRSYNLHFFVARDNMQQHAFLNTFKYFTQADMVIKSVAVSLMTLFLLSTIESAVNGVICKKIDQTQSKNRYFWLIGIFVANILGSTPINMVRFGWAYTEDQRSGDRLRTSFVILLFLLLSCFYLGSKTKNDPFPMKAKVTLVILGLALLVIFDTMSTVLNTGTQYCPRTVDGVSADSYENDDENLKRKKQALRMIQKVCLVVMIILYASPIIVQLKTLNTKRSMNQILNSVPQTQTSAPLNSVPQTQTSAPTTPVTRSQTNSKTRKYFSKTVQALLM